MADLGGWRQRLAGWAGRTDAGTSHPSRIRATGRPAGRSQAERQPADVFVVGGDGAVWLTWEAGDSAWRDGLDGRMPVRVTPPGFAPPGAPLAAAKQNDNQLMCSSSAATARYG